MFNRNDGPPTTTILTIDLPPELGLRLRKAMRRDSQRSIKALTLEALEAWIERDEEKARIAEEKARSEAQGGDGD